MKLTIKKYRFNVANPQQAKDYKALWAKLQSQGLSCFHVYADRGDFYDNIPEVVTVETDILFNNQFNADYGRLFDWYEGIVQNPDIKQGYYVSCGLNELNKLRDSRLVCGYCGKQYEKESTDQQFCGACISNEYLTEKDLFLLRLLPVSAKKDRSKEIPEQLRRDYQRLKFDHEAARIIRLKQKAERLRANAEEENQQNTYKAQNLCALLDAGIDTENLIYYSHTGSWCFGWRDAVTEAEKLSFYEQCRHALYELNAPLDPEFLEKLNFKMR